MIGNYTVKEALKDLLIGVAVVAFFVGICIVTWAYLY